MVYSAVYSKKKKLLSTPVPAPHPYRGMEPYLLLQTKVLFTYNTWLR